MKQLTIIMAASACLLACGSGSESNNTVTRTVCTPTMNTMAAMGMTTTMPSCEQPLICLANPSNGATGICVPACATNDQCGGGEVCNVGLCTPTGYLMANMVPGGPMPGLG
ncbi:MAG: hypothetical protein VX589_10295, partial [Myxococcota bacterium]|nr:hypothetical protein [Myxococcota bacterium]